MHHAVFVTAFNFGATSERAYGLFTRIACKIPPPIMATLGCRMPWIA
jgi:hypothetical protein